MEKRPTPTPRAPKIGKYIQTHGHRRYDPYFWLRNRENADVKAYLEAENQYLSAEMVHTQALQEKLYQEMRGRLVEDDRSVPYYQKGYWYLTRFRKGEEYPRYCRKIDLEGDDEEELLNVNALAEGHSYYRISGLSISPNQEWLAFGADNQGRRLYEIHFKHLPSGKILSQVLTNTTGGGSWSACGQYFFYTQKDDTLRPYKVLRHHFQAAREDVEVYCERDVRFVCGVYRSKSDKYLLIGCSSTDSNEFHYLPADKPLEGFQPFQKRQEGLEYGIMHFGKRWYIRTNHNQASNFQIMECPEEQTGIAHWKPHIPNREEVYLEGAEIFRDHLVLEERENGLNRLRVIPWKAPKKEHYIDFSGETYHCSLGHNPDFDSPYLRYHFSSLTEPPCVIDYHRLERSKILRKRQEIPGGYQADAYESHRVWARSEDGTAVPISLVYRADKRRPKGNPTLLYGYGAYGLTVDPGFSVLRLSLLERGFVFAIAHVRGGQYLGRRWYEEGRLAFKQNTFNDYIACGRYLLKQGIAAQGQLFGMGGSAGGLLIGAVINQAPHLLRAAVAAVPFVDVLNTMLDESIPLTADEYREWGDPREAEAYRRIYRYSPYDQVRKQAYPALLITAGFHDSQVQYWEPAKWCARLRERKTDTHPLFLHTQMEAGHSGASGRYAALREIALEYAFLLDQAGINE